MTEKKTPARAGRGSRFATVLAVFLIALASGAAHAGRFEVVDERLVHDREAGLLWMRCSVGQEPRDGRCAGEAERFVWTAAEQRVETLEPAACPWRLPGFHELRSLLQDGAEDPAIDTAVFPGTPSGWYWADATAAGHSPYDCFVDFSGAGRTLCNTSGRFHLRAVVESEHLASCRR